MKITKAQQCITAITGWMNKLKEQVRDLWYKKMGDRIPIKPEDESAVGLMEWVDLMVRNH